MVKGHSSSIRPIGPHRYLHDVVQIVHCDVKPDNLLLRRGSTVHHIKSAASSDFNFTIFLQVEFVSVFQFFQLESITLTNSEKIYVS